jgi:exonuclease VII small subunit
MNEHRKHLAESIQRLEEIQAALDQELAKLRRLHDAVDHLVPPLDTWQVAPEPHTEN